MPLRHSKVVRGKAIFDKIGGSGMEEKEFDALIEAKIKQGASFIAALYQTLDQAVASEIEASGFQLACQKGCASCCQQLVNCTRIEAQLIAEFIRDLPPMERQELAKEAWPRILAWRHYHQKNPAAATTLEQVLRIHDDWLNKPCPFLDAKLGTCRIYPVRPIDCRTLLSQARCACGQTDGAKRFPFPCQLWAN
ncbi:MAG: YkgJ family cysteine cluster protein, partial [Candidatus Magasanikbacteria bacterium]|nr:YkgJ family cysteine cluster protein [Candidatus Magasanikbacteria bacterium]